MAEENSKILEASFQNDHSEGHKDDNKHDHVDKDGYKKRCYCQKCVKRYKEWCEKKKDEGCTTCKRRCYTVCEIKCEKTDIIRTYFGFHEKFEGKWERYDSQPVPKHCNKCKREEKECECSKKH